MNKPFYQYQKCLYETSKAIIECRVIDGYWNLKHEHRIPKKWVLLVHSRDFESTKEYREVYLEEVRLL